MTGPLLLARGISADIDGRRIVDGVDLTVRAGKVVAVLGRSGAGKSTLLRAIAGLAGRIHGTIELDGVDITAVPTHRRDIGFMFQHHALFPHLDVAGNVAFGLRMRRVDRSSIARRVDEVLELVGLSGFGRRGIDELSGGEAQRVALARALAPSPRVLLLDEPLASLDLPRRRELLTELKRLLTELGQSAAYVTHDRDEAMSIADELVVLDNGRVVRSGDPGAVWNDPQSALVAQVLGHVNVVASAALVESGLVPDLHIPESSTVLVPRRSIMLDPDGIPATVTARGLAGDDAACSVSARGVELATGFDAPIGTEVRISLDANLLRPLTG